MSNLLGVGSIQVDGDVTADNFIGTSSKTKGLIYITGNTTGTAGTWTGTSSDITEYYDGLMIAYKVGIAGANPTTLNINGLGATTVVRQATTSVSTNYPVNTVVILVYTTDGSTHYWKTADYDANTNTQVRQYVTATDTEYSILTRYNTASVSSYEQQYARFSNDVKINPSTGTVIANNFLKGGSELTSKRSTTITVPASGGTVTVTGMTATADVVVGPAPQSIEVYANAGCYCSAQGADSLTFTVSQTASADMSVNVMWFL